MVIFFLLLCSLNLILAWTHWKFEPPEFQVVVEEMNILTTVFL